MTAETIRTIRLYGRLGTIYGREHRLAVNNAAEAIRALCAMVPGFERELMQSKAKGIGYALFYGTQNIGENEMFHPPGTADIRIAPMIQGSKRGGWFQIVLGVALIAVAWWNPGSYLAAGGLFSAQTVGALGFSFALGGVAQLISTHQQGLAGRDGPDNGASYNFTGPVNVTTQGNPVPLLYGEMIVGSATVSAGVYSEDQQ